MDDDWEPVVKESDCCFHCGSYHGKDELVCNWGSGQTFVEACEACTVPFCKGRRWVFACVTCGHLTELVNGGKI